MVKLEELSMDQKRKYSLIKGSHNFKEGLKIGLVIETQGIRYISANYEKEEIVLYKPMNQSRQEKIIIQKLTENGLGQVQVGIPKEYVEEITE